MRKAMWKKGLSVAMAAAMLTGTVTVPAVFNSSAIVKAETKDQNEESYYVLMNIPYAQFYKNELNNNNIDVDAFTSATKAKTRTGNLVAGSYHVNSDGSDITGITYPVKVSKNTDLSKFKLKEITDNDSLEITTTNRGQTSTATYKGKDALFESASYSYYKLSEAPSYYKELTVNEDGSFFFGKSTASVTKVTGAKAELETQTTYGDYQLNLDFDGVTDDAKIDGNTKVYAAVITTTDGTQYGLRHMENIWRGTELAWSTGFTKAVHNCPTSSEHYKSMMGKTINAVTYYTDNGVFEYSLDKLYVPVKFDSSKYSVENADVTTGKTSVALPELPNDYDAVYSVEGLEGVKVENGVLTYDASKASKGSYTLTIKDNKGKYATLESSFELYTTKIPAAFNNDVNAPALVKASDATAADFADFIGGIESVSVNGKSYAQSGRGAVKLINADGTLIKDAEPLKEEGTYNISVKSSGYKAFEFTYSNKKAEAPATTETKPAATTTATQPTTAAKSTTKKVTVKKQTAKVKAGKKKLTVTWKKDKNVSGYQIQIATKKNFKGAKTYTVKSYKTYKKVIKKLKANKKYFVKVRAYKTVGKSKVYGAYSAVKSCKVK